MLAPTPLAPTPQRQPSVPGVARTIKTQRKAMIEIMDHFKHSRWAAGFDMLDAWMSASWFEHDKIQELTRERGVTPEIVLMYSEPSREYPTRNVLHEAAHAHRTSADAPPHDPHASMSVRAREQRRSCKPRTTITSSPRSCSSGITAPSRT
eukprot:6582997-Prymnesium_polylepis.1